MSFKLKAPFSPSGDQPEAIDKLTKALAPPDGKAVLVGVTGSGKTMTMASVVERLGRKTLVLTHNKTLAAQLYREFAEFFPENAVEYFISYYDYYQPEAYIPVSDTFIEKDASINDEIEMLRLRATSSLLERDDVIIVASVSCIYGLGSPEEYKNSVMFLKEGDQISREEIMHGLLAMQYARNDVELKPGFFRSRGDAVDILPAYSQEIYRIEMFGDSIDGIYKLDRITGRKTARLKMTAVYPAKHFITSPIRLKSALDKIRDELKERVEYFRKNNKPLEAERIQQRTMYDLEMLKEMGYCSGIENYSRHLSEREPGSRPAVLLDYFPEDFLVIIDESHVTVPQIRGMHAGDRSRKETLVEFGFRLPSALDNRPLNYPEFASIAKNVLYVSATPADYELGITPHHVYQIIRPTGLLDPEVVVRPSEGQMEDLAHEIEARARINERVLVTTLTKKMAEDLTDYFTQQGMRVRYMHSEIDAIERTEILYGLRKGEFDTLIGINLLREGLDLPEVSLVAILDADKEGFLRSRTSLIQTMGRAARNINGMVILYADTMTDSMRYAIEETTRRRNLQREFNEKNGIIPQSIRKDVRSILDRQLETVEAGEPSLELARQWNRKNFRSASEWKDKLQTEMLTAAKNLDFEKAALLRDILFEKNKTAFE